jgi:hypothetical protein
LLFNFALEFAARKVQESQVELKLNGTHHLLTYADDVNLLRNNIYTTKEKTDAVTDGTKKIDLEVYAEKTACIYMCRHQNAGEK